MLFLAEGFTAADEAEFDRIVTEVTSECSQATPRTLRDALALLRRVQGVMPSNDGSSPAASRWRAPQFRRSPRARRSIRVRDHQRKTPSPNWLPAWDPMRGEVRGEGDLKTLWNSRVAQRLPLTRSTPRCSGRGRTRTPSVPGGARHVLRHDRRRALGRQGISARSAIATPAADDGSAPLKALVKRAYEFDRLGAARASISTDAAPAGAAAQATRAPPTR